MPAAFRFLRMAPFRVAPIRRAARSVRASSIQVSRRLMLRSLREPRASGLNAGACRTKARQQGRRPARQKRKRLPMKSCFSPNGDDDAARLGAELARDGDRIKL